MPLDYAVLMYILYTQGGPLNSALLKNCSDQDRQYLNVCSSSPGKGWFGVCRYLTTALFNKTVGGGDHLFYAAAVRAACTSHLFMI
jgi:hypothetical protein